MWALGPVQSRCLLYDVRAKSLLLDSHLFGAFVLPILEKRTNTFFDSFPYIILCLWWSSFKFQLSHFHLFLLHTITSLMKDCTARTSQAWSKSFFMNKKYNKNCNLYLKLYYIRIRILTFWNLFFFRIRFIWFRPLLKTEV